MYSIPGCIFTTRGAMIKSHFEINLNHHDRSAQTIQNNKIEYGETDRDSGFVVSELMYLSLLRFPERGHYE